MRGLQRYREERQLTTHSQRLIVYKASAGSGKTFNLAVEYIMLLIENPECYRNILAVTFTNKATEEMKTRILSQLYGISHGLSASENYMNEIVSRRRQRAYKDLSPQNIRQRAGMALDNLLNNYNYFRVETIDSFFQSVMKNLAKELDLTPNLRIDLSDTKVKDEAVDRIIETLDDDAKTKKQIIKFVEESIEDDHGWNVIRKIKDFSSTIFKDFYKENSERLNQAINDIDAFEKQLKEFVKEFEGQMLSIADEFERQFAGIEISGRNNISNYYKNIRKGEYQDSILLKNYVKKVLDDETAIAHDITVRCEKYRKEHIGKYLSAKAVLPYIGQLLLLNKVEETVHHLNNDANRFLLSDTQHLLQRMIDNDDASFIYEKTGSHLRHIMIDEFQDTSIVQWKNFRILLDDCLAQVGCTSLIVGDVKQSIYRWRSGDWRLLHNIENEFSDNIRIETLQNNFRSAENIVDFNNRFFKAYIKQMPEVLQKAYDDVEQQSGKTSAKGKGLIRVTFTEDSEDERDAQSAEVYRTITVLKEQGVKNSSIAILLRKNDKIQQIANWFAHEHPEIPLVSEEAFLLSSSKAVNIIMSAVTYIVRHDDISMEYLNEHCGDDVQDFIKRIDELKRMPLFLMVERIFQILHIEKLQDESTFVCTFFDNLMQFIQDNPANATLFVREWENTLSTKKIVGTDIDGIRLMTIHKSKGLEFDHVIIPFCDWQKEKSALMWVSTEEKKGWDDIPILPVMYSQKLADTVFAKEYEEEHVQNMMDNLNMLYVAFTRASKNMFIVCQKKVASNQINKNIQIALEEAGIPQIADGIYEMGSLYIGSNSDKEKGKVEEDTKKNVFLTPAKTIHTQIVGEGMRTEFRQSNKSNYFVNDGTEEHDETKRERGILLHAILSEIETTADVKKVIYRYERDGMFSQFITKEEAEKTIRESTSHPQMEKWFSGEWNICNERDILIKGRDYCVKRRCDRILYNDKETVVIDFKFGKPMAGHTTQVREYVDLLREIGFKNVHGYLWYAEHSKLEEVK